MTDDIWWTVKVLDKETNTTTSLSKHGDIPSIKEELELDGWIFISAYPESEQ